MPKSSKKFIDELIEVIQKQAEEKNIRTFLVGILSKQELDEIARRLQIVKSLKAGQTQREIAERLGVGIATVTRGSKELKKGRFKNI